MVGASEAGAYGYSQEVENFLYSPEPQPRGWCLSQWATSLTSVNLIKLIQAHLVACLPGDSRVQADSHHELPLELSPQGTFRREFFAERPYVRRWSSWWRDNSDINNLLCPEGPCCVPTGLCVVSCLFLVLTWVGFLAFLKLLTWMLRRKVSEGDLGCLPSPSYLSDEVQEARTITVTPWGPHSAALADGSMLTQ